MEKCKVPQHVAIILDGNGRWAKAKGLPRNAGHVAGAKNVENICRAAHELGIRYLTVYAFSTENWRRPGDEVEALMKLLRDYMKTCQNLAKKNNMRCRVIGDRSGLAPDLQESIQKLEEASAGYDGLTFVIALNYGGRDEIVRGIRGLCEDVKQGKVSVEEISDQLVGGYLDTADIPDPDLLIRTSGEQRLSNFMLWELAYSEFYFSPVHWPDFDKAELEKAVEAYGNRDRRYGGLKEE
ncbi:MAG: isoprenyl transferase [Lachnospiraceae bacterium]|nr:isoprenyl transferase [Lachnospiraceae bacterium]